MRRRSVWALPVAVAALAFAPLAHAGTVAPVVYTPTTSAQLQSNVTSADSAPAGTLSIIQLAAGVKYVPTQALSLSGNIEITGPPTYQAPTLTTTTSINGSTVFNNTPKTPLIIVNPGAHILLKGFDLDNGGTSTTPSIQNSGGLELDQMAVEGSNDAALINLAGSTAIATNSDLSDGTGGGVLDNGGTATLINDTIYNNQTYGIEGSGGNSFTIHNDIIALDHQAAGAPSNCNNAGTFTATGTESDDASCGPSVTNDPNLGAAMGFTGINGGPTQSTSDVGTSAVAFGDTAYCPTADQRFFRYTGKCDAGSFQSGGTRDTSTTGPVCMPQTPNESTNPAVASTMTVNVQEATGIGLGADAVNNTTTDNGSVSYPTTGGWMNAVNPSLTIDPAYPSRSAYGVTASKPAGDLTTGDTHWSFLATDWLGNTTNCR